MSRAETSSAAGFSPTTSSKRMDSSAPMPPGSATAPVASLPEMVRGMLDLGFRRRRGERESDGGRRPQDAARTADR